MWTAWKAIPTLSRTCAHCCSGLSAAHGSADQWRILVGPDAHKIDEPSAGCPSAPTMSISSSSSRARSAGACLPDIAPALRFPTGGEVGEGPYLDLPRKATEANMTEFAGRTAVVTGGGSGMGRELVRQ